MVAHKLMGGKLPGMLGIDAVISVGAVQEYSKAQRPELYKNSNYGKDVNILAPGTNIAVLGYSGTAKISAGTSDATAIVSAVVALMTSCNPFATAFEIKKVLLERAKVHEHLKGKAKDGKVLDAWKAVEAFCVHEDDDDPYSAQEAAGQKSSKTDL